MLIKGFQATSLVDYPGNICSVVFTGGCNLRCPYCHNSALVTDLTSLPTYDESTLLAQFTARKKLIDGVCITGGEPTLQPDLLEFITKIKKLGLKVKLDTNGTNPDVVEKLIELGLLDYVAMDIKQIPTEDGKVNGRYWGYEKATGISSLNSKTAQQLIENIAKTIELLKDAKIDHEFRTTVVPDFTNKEDIRNIAKMIPCEKYYIQQFVPSSGMFDTSITNKYADTELTELAEQLNKEQTQSDKKMQRKIKIEVRI